MFTPIEAEKELKAGAELTPGARELPNVLENSSINLILKI